jgi:hypothetical protein
LRLTELSQSKSGCGNRLFVLPSVRNTKRHKLASLLPTWRRGLDRLYSKSLSAGSHQDLQRPYLHGVPHGTQSAGRPSWHGRYALCLAKASRRGWRATCHEIGNQPTSLELFSPLLAVARVREVSVLQAASLNQFFLARHHTKLMCKHVSTDIQGLHSAQSASCTRYDIQGASIHVQDRQEHLLERPCSSAPARRYMGAWRYISMGDHVQSYNAPPRHLW